MIRFTAAFPPSLPLHARTGRRAARLLLAATLLWIAPGCDEGGGSEPTPQVTPPSPPPAPPVVTIVDGLVTATFATKPGYGYIVHYGPDEGTVYFSHGPFDSSPAQFGLSQRGMWLFSLSRTRDGLESARTGYDQAPVLDTPGLMLVEEQGASNLLEADVVDDATATSVIYRNSCAAAPDADTWLGDVTNPLDNQLTHTLTDFWDAGLTPCTYSYGVYAHYTVGDIVKSVTDTVFSAYSTPDLANFRLYQNATAENGLQAGTNPAAPAGNLMQVVGSTVYWLCEWNGGTYCYMPHADAGTVANPPRYATTLSSDSWLIKAFSVEPDESAIYFLHGANAIPTVARFTPADLTEIVLLTHGEPLVGLAQDATHLYLHSDTAVLEVLKSATVPNTTPSTSLRSGRSGVRHLTLEGNRLFFADDAGLHYLNVPGGTVPVTLSTTHTAVTAIATEGDLVFFIAASQTTLGAQALFRINLTAGPAVATIQERLYNAHDLALTGGRVYWADNSKVYSVSAGGGGGLGHLTTSARTIEAAGTDEVIVGAGANLHLYKLPLVRQFPPPDVPPAPEPLTVMVGDSGMDVVWTGVSAADAYQLLVGGVYHAAAALYGNVFGLVNGTPYDVEVRGVNLTGTGAAATAQATPRIASPELVLDPGNNRIVLKLNQPKAYDAEFNGIRRKVQFHLYRHTGTSVDTTGVPIAAVYGESDTFGGIYVEFEDLDATNGGPYWFYNATVSDVDLLDGAGVPTPVPTPTTSEPSHVAGAEPYANAAAPLVVVVTGGAAYDEYRMSLTWANGTLYWVNNSPTPWKGFTYDFTQTRVPFTPLDTWEALTGDGTLLYATKPGELAWLNPADTTPVALPLLTTAQHPDFTGAINGLTYHHDGTDGWLIVTVNHQAVIKVKTDGSGATTLSATAYTPPMGQLAARDGWVYWSEQSRVKRVPLAGGAAETMVANAGGDVFDLAVNATHLYWTAWSAIYRMPLAGGDTVLLGKGAAVAVDPATGRVYWDNNDIFTLDGSGRTLTVATRPTAMQDYRRIRILNGKVYSYSGNEIEATPLVP